MEKYRSFIAINLPAETKQKLADFLHSFRKIKGLKWVKPENLHLTLHFLGDISQDGLVHLSELIARIIDQYPSFPLTVEKLGCFPRREQPQVLFFACPDQEKKAQILQEKIGEQLRQSGFRIDHRPWKAHITFARVKKPSSLDRLWRKEQEFNLQRFSVSSVELMTSELTPQGPIYKVVKKIPFKKSHP